MFRAKIKTINHTAVGLTVEMEITADGFEPQPLKIDAAGLTPATFETAVKTQLAGLNTNGELAKWLYAEMTAGTAFTA